MRRLPLKSILVLTIMISFIQISGANKKSYDYSIIEIENISRYIEDRISYQQIDIPFDEYSHSNIDNSIASLLIIRDKKIYLFKDGYEDTSDVTMQKRILEMENKLIPDLWVNKIDGKPDYIRLTDRRVELIKQIAPAGENLNEEFVKKYQTIRNSFIKKHVQIFRSLFINRKESYLTVSRTPIPKRLADSSDKTLYFTSVTGKTIDGTLYYAEDADGDDFTETLMVSLPDGFHWGHKSGPNIIYIYKNTQDEIKEIIKDIAKEALYGTEEEKELIRKSFLKDEDVQYMIDDLYKIDAETRKMMNDAGIKSK